MANAGAGRHGTDFTRVGRQSGAGELYDLENDPHELVNLFEAEHAAGVPAELETMLHSRPDDALPLQTQVGMA